MGDKLYNTYPNNMYNRAPCAKQPPEQQYYYNMPISNNYNQIEPFNLLSPKNNTYNMYPDNITWCEETLKIPDKIEMIEITSKDLSPASYCSNLDLLMPDFYKTLGKDVNFYNGQYNYNQKVEYPSCAQSAQNSSQGDKVKYCSIQKQQEFDYGYSYVPQEFFPYENKLESGQYFDSFQPIDQQTESNDESDIVVEDSDEDITDCVFGGSKLPSKTNKCVICNVLYSTMGTQFYHLTAKSPLTMSSQKPVFSKIENILGKLGSDLLYLCSECLGLINTIDHLQFKLDNFNKELVTKFQKTCMENNATFAQKRKEIKVRKSYRIRCRQCRKVLCLKQFFKRHLLRHKCKGFLCEQCGKIFIKFRNFKVHYRQHKPRKPKISSFSCTNCPKYFRTKSNLKEHENFCLGLLPFSCKFCDKKFPSTTKLKNHVKLKHDKKFVAICSICNIGFVKLSDYKSHKISHSTDKKFACDQCDKTYKTLSNLNFHRKVHNAKLPFICAECGKGFMRKEYLEAHVNNHNGIKNFSCHLCDKKFVAQKNLDAHLKYHDGSTKSNTCNICGKVMATGFEEHLRVHNNLREFECDLCDSRFNTKGTLAKHKKRKHPNV